MKPPKNVNCLNKIQLDSINALFKTVLKQNKFYQLKYSQKLLLKGIKTQKDFFDLPFIEREEIVRDQQTNPPYGTNFSYPRKNYFYIKSTSGSSGSPKIHFPYLLEDLERRSYFIGKVIKKLLKIKKGDRIICWMSPGAAYYDSMALKKAGYQMFPLEGFEDNQKILDKICFFNIQSLKTTPTKLFSLMKYIREKNINPRSLPLKNVIAGGEGFMENLSAVKLVRKYLNAECFSSAGSTECGQFASQCIYHNFHLIDEGYIYEIINPTTLKHDTKGELVITPLWHKGYPLIRYKTGDHVEIDGSPCPCGYPSSIIKPASLYRYDDLYTINSQIYTSVNFDEYIRKYIGINSYYIEILDEKIVIKIEKDELSKQITKKLTIFLNNKLNFKIKIKFIKNSGKDTNNWKFNRITDKRNKPKMKFHIKVLLKILNIIQDYLNKGIYLHS